jgi:hypothetical protein
MNCEICNTIKELIGRFKKKDDKGDKGDMTDLTHY